MARSKELLEKERTGWIVAHILDEVAKEEQYAAACNLKAFQQRAQEAGGRI